MKVRLSSVLGLALAVGVGCAAQAAQSWTPASGHIVTRWAKDVSPEKVHPEYPRPQMVRRQWMNLNGLWDFAVAKKDDPKPSDFGQKILVPFAPESALSGIGRTIKPEDRIWYRRTFELPKAWKGKRVLANFGAVDWDTTVYLNGAKVGAHTGGYDPFGFDITDALRPSGAQEIVLSVWDPTDAGGQPRGKQVLGPGGIMYTGTSGIWQTVWLEPAPKAHIVSYKAVPDVDKQLLRVTVAAAGKAAKPMVKVQAMASGKVVSAATGKPGVEMALPIRSPKLWSPSSPFLYDLRISLLDGRKTVDTVGGYFGMRKVSVKKDASGVNRLAINDKIAFQFGPLDQGFWPDGIYTAPTDEALRYDLEFLKQLGCNMLRKHVKIEPERYYYWADKLGMLIWQDMPSGFGNNTPTERTNFEDELRRMIDDYINHPSIIMWVVFNEGWGQYDTPRLVEMVEKLDPSRLVDDASGWSDEKVGDVIDVHSYPGPDMPSVEPNRAAVLGEFGGLGLTVKGHTWNEGGSWGYVSFEDKKAITDRFVGLLASVLPLIEKGLSAAVYTQTTDVEVEVNGMMTYDRAMCKFDEARAKEAVAKVYKAAP